MLKILPNCFQVSWGSRRSISPLLLLTNSCFFRLHVRLNLSFLPCKRCLSWELFGSWEIYSLRDFRFSFSVSHSRSNQLFCDMALVLLRWTFKPAFLHASTRVSLNNSAAVSTLSFLKAACSLDWTICDSRHSFNLFFNLVSHNSPGADPGEVKWVNFHPPFSEPPSFFFFLIPQILK